MPSRYQIRVNLSEGAYERLSELAKDACVSLPTYVRELAERKGDVRQEYFTHLSARFSVLSALLLTHYLPKLHVDPKWENRVAELISASIMNLTGDGPDMPDILRSEGTAEGGSYVKELMALSRKYAARDLLDF